MIARLQVNRWEHPCFGQLIKQVLSTRKWVSVADCNCIECSVVNDHAEGAIFFGNKQDGRTKRRCRWSDPFLLHQNRDLALDFFQFLWTEPVDRLERGSEEWNSRRIQSSSTSAPASMQCKHWLLLHLWLCWQHGQTDCCLRWLKPCCSLGKMHWVLSVWDLWCLAQALWVHSADAAGTCTRTCKQDNTIWYKWCPESSMWDSDWTQEVVLTD